MSRFGRTSKEIRTLRDGELNGRCGICEFKYICKGCRARALATTGNQMNEDAWCDYIPGKYGNKVIQLSESETFGTDEIFTMTWSGEAKNIIKQIPSFSRGMVIKGVERFAERNNYSEITPEIMKASREEMEINNKTAFPKSSGDIYDRDIVNCQCENKTEEEIPWTDDARKRVSNAPDFVRPGIFKLMQKKARQHGYKEITSKFLSEIRDESMRLASRRIKNIGFDELQMEAWDKAKEKLKSARKVEVIDKIKIFLEERVTKNNGIIAKFQAYLRFSSNTVKKETVGEPVWTEEAKRRMERAPVFARGRAIKSIEDYAIKRGVSEITVELINEYMKNIPAFVKDRFK